MKQLFIIAVIFLSLNSKTLFADEKPFDNVNVERVKAEKNYFRARTLVDGLKANKSLSRRIYYSAVKKAEEHLAASDVHLSKSREYLLKELHNGNITELSSKKLTVLLKNLKYDIDNLRASIEALHLSFSSNTATKKIVVDGPSRAVAVDNFLDWHDFVIQLRETESAKWLKSDITKHWWEKASAESGFYGRHIDHLADSVIYANNRERITREDYYYVKNGMKRFMDFHDQFIDLLGKLRVANNADLRDKQKKIEGFIKPYSTINVFSALPSHKVIPVLPVIPVDDMDYVPPQSMMSAFSELPSRPSLGWLKKDKNAMQVFRVLYDNGVAQEFLKKFVNLNGKLTVGVTDNTSGKEMVRLSFGGDLYIPDDNYINGNLKADTKLLASLLRELFHAYCIQIVDANKDAATKTILENTEIWLTGQYIRLESNRNSSRPWSDFSSEIKDAKGFTEDYVANIIGIAYSSHAEQEGGEISLLNRQYSADQNDDGVRWDVQSVPPSFLLNYINAFFGFGVY